MFNAHWATLGGGEQLAGGIAAALARHDDVELLVEEPFDAVRASERLGFALTGLPQREINPGKRSLLDATAGFDVLVNTSFASTAAHAARHGVYYVHFPVPDGRAAAWDAPLAEAAPHNFGMGPIFGTQANFESYRVETLLSTQAACLGDKPRLVLVGYGNFRQQHVRIHEEMVRWGIPHIYRDGPTRKHHWASGWVPEAVELLVGLR